MNSHEDDQFQKRSPEIGIGFRKECKQLFEDLGFSFSKEFERLEDYGVQIELIYHNNQGIALFFEAAGTIEDEPLSPRPGLVRTDTVKKIIANAYLVHKCLSVPTMVLTSHPPNPESSSAKMLNMAGRNIIFDVICINDEFDIERLKSYLDMDQNDFWELENKHESLF